MIFKVINGVVLQNLQKSNLSYKKVRTCGYGEKIVYYKYRGQTAPEYLKHGGKNNGTF